MDRHCLGSRIGVAILGAALTLGSCSDSPEPTAAEPVGGSTVAETSADAPEEWSTFLAWADARLRETPAAVPLPAEPCLPEPRWPIVRLDEMFDEAAVSCDWQPAAGSSEPLVALGPFRSDRPGRGLRVLQHHQDRKLGAGTHLSVSGFRVQREDVGSISIEVRVPFGRHVDLSWSSVGRIRVPLPDNQSFWALNIASDGLVDWFGPLDHLQLSTDGAGEGVIEIRSLRFLPRQDAFPQPAGVRRVHLSRESRNAVYAHCPATVTFSDVRLPERAKLQIGLAHLAFAAGHQPAETTPSERGETAATNAVRFEVILEHDGQQTPVLDQFLEPGERWTDVSVGLEEWSGKTVSVTLRATGGNSSSIVLWANPFVYQPLDDPPCVVLYLIDTLSAKHIDLYGYDRRTTPNISALAAEGVWFARMFCNSPVTVASVPDTQLSMPTERHGVYAASIAAPLELVTLAEVLRAAGFATALFSTNCNAGPRQSMDQGFDCFIDRGIFAKVRDRTVPLEEVRKWLEAHRDRPTFMYIHTAEPHAPYLPPAGFAGRFDPDYAGTINGTLGQSGFLSARSERDIAHVAALYDEEVLYADARFGMFLDLLGGLRVRDQANIFLIADHGEELMEHGNWGHGSSLSNEVLSVPLFVAGPLVTARDKVDVPAQLYDIMPTILALFDLPEPYELSGKSLLPFLRSEIEADRGAFDQRPIVHSHHRYVGLGVVQYAVIDPPRWKLTYTYDESAANRGDKSTNFALHDLQASFYGQEDIIDAHRDLARQLIVKLIAYRQRQHPYAAGAGEEELKLDPEQIRELQALGYVGGDEDEDEDD